MSRNEIFYQNINPKPSSASSLNLSKGNFLKKLVEWSCNCLAMSGPASHTGGVKPFSIGGELIDS